MGIKSLNCGVAALLLSTIATTSTAQDMAISAIQLPTKEQEEFLRSEDATVTRGPGPLITTSLMVTSLPRDSIHFEMASVETPLKQPLQSANELIILLRPDLSGEAIKAALQEHRLKAVDTLPQIGGVVVDTSRRLGADSLFMSAATFAEANSSRLGKLADELAKDERFVAVVPNTLVSTFELKSAVHAVVDPPQVGAATEEDDWGIADAGFDKIWGRLTKPIKVGVIDVGFADHEDLDVEKAFPGQLRSHNHGNHVAGIMCAKHNQLGVRGALPNCKVVISSANLMLPGVEGDGPNAMVAHLSEYVGTVLDFLDQRSDVRVINLSLGYNWMPNFKLDPRVPGARDVRDDISGQGRIFASVLKAAKRRNVAMVMAAGNDSSELKTPLQADLASPFSFGSRLIEKAEGWTNGVIVEAYDSKHARAVFSNVGGHLACPGVEVLSTIASSPKSYGRMSGTSMASPYCAAGLAAVLALRPDLNLQKAIECLVSGPDKIENRVPRLNVEKAVTACKLPPP